MANQIVTVNVSQQVAPTPSTLQQTGAMLSQGGTTTAPGTASLITQASDLTPLLAAAQPLASISQSAGVATATLESTTIASGTYNSTTGLVTLTLTGSIGVVTGNMVVISAATGTGSVSSINGTFVAGPGSTGTTLTYTIAPALTLTISGGNAVASTGLDNGSTFLTTIAGATPAGYNGTVTATVTGTTTFTFPVPSSLSTPATGSPTATPPSVAELVAMVSTFFAQGSSVAVYVLELGAGTPAAGVSYLTTWIAANSQQQFYSYLVPRSWAAESTYLTFLASFEASTAKTYFFTTLTAATYSSFTAAMKCVVGMVEAPSVPVTEFSIAAVFWVTLHYAPSSTNKITPTAFSFLSGVTPYPTRGNGAFLAALKAAGVNVVGTGAEGQISNTVLFWGTTMDGNDFTYWYSIDWVQINVDANIANAVINGSNDPINPLFYTQDGINRLQGVVAATMASGVSFGLVLFAPVQTELDSLAFTEALDADTFVGQTVVNAVPFRPYSQANPGDYKIGRYAGLSVIYTPTRGFISIVFNVLVTQFVAQ